MHIKNFSLFKLSSYLFLFLMQLVLRYVSLFFFLFKLYYIKIYRELIKTLNQLYHARKHLQNCIEFIKGNMAIYVGFFMYLRSGKLRKLRRYYSYLTQVETDPHQIAFIHMAGRVSKWCTYMDNRRNQSLF